MTVTVDALAVEYSQLKRNLNKIISNCMEKTTERSFDEDTLEDIAQSFSILECNVDQTDKLFQLAHDEGNTHVMRNIIENNFRTERKMIQNIAITVYNVDEAQGLKIAYEICRSQIDEQIQALQNSFEDLVRSSGVELEDHVDYKQIFSGFDTHQKQKRDNDELFEQEFNDNDIRGMAVSIAVDIPKELRIINSLERKLNRLYSYLN